MRVNPNGNIAGKQIVSQTKANYRQYNSVPPKTTDNTYQRVTSMQEIMDQNSLTKNFPNTIDKTARVLKTSTPYKTNNQMLSQIKDRLNEPYSDFTDINSFKMIGNYIETSQEFKEKKIFPLNLEKNLANLRFSGEKREHLFDPKEHLTEKKEFFLDKKPMFPSIKTSLELKSRSEFMKLDLNPLNMHSFNMNNSGEDLKNGSMFAYADFKLTPHESKKMVIPSPLDYSHHDNEFHGVDEFFFKTPNLNLDLNKDNEILVEDHTNDYGKTSSKNLSKVQNYNMSNGISQNENDGFNPYITATSINTVNTNISKNKFPREVFKPNMKKKIVI